MKQTYNITCFIGNWGASHLSSALRVKWNEKMKDKPDYNKSSYSKHQYRPQSTTVKVRAPPSFLWHATLLQRSDRFQPTLCAALDAHCPSRGQHLVETSLLWNIIVYWTAIQRWPWMNLTVISRISEFFVDTFIACFHTLTNSNVGGVVWLSG